MKKGFYLYTDTLRILDKLTCEQGMELFKAMRDYHDHKPLDLSFAVDLVFDSFKLQFDRDIANYDGVVIKNKMNGAKGGRPKKPKQPK